MKYSGDIWAKLQKTDFVGGKNYHIRRESGDFEDVEGIDAIAR